MSETPARLSHRLSVVWFTDLVGYSTLAARDQDRAVALVQRFQEIVERTVPREAGRVVKFIGDAALLESPSADAALQAATALRPRPFPGQQHSKRRINAGHRTRRGWEISARNR